jgi:transcriptional regulator with XRE-family HTH domain
MTNTKTREKVASAVGNTIKRRREELGRTQTQVAKRAGVSRGFLAHVENSTRTVSFDTLQRLIRALS